MVGSGADGLCGCPRSLSSCQGGDLAEVPLPCKTHGVTPPLGENEGRPGRWQVGQTDCVGASQAVKLPGGDLAEIPLP